MFLGCYRLGSGFGSSAAVHSEAIASTAITCQLSCQESPHCNVFSWKSISQKCFLGWQLPQRDPFQYGVPSSMLGSKYCVDVRIIWPEIYATRNESALVEGGSYRSNQLTTSPTQSGTATRTATPKTSDLYYN